MVRVFEGLCVGIKKREKGVEREGQRERGWEEGKGKEEGEEIEKD